MNRLGNAITVGTINICRRNMDKYHFFTRAGEFGDAASTQDIHGQRLVEWRIEGNGGSTINHNVDFFLESASQGLVDS